MSDNSERRTSDIAKHILFSLISVALTVLFTVPVLRADIDNIKENNTNLEERISGQIKDLKADTEKKYDYLVGRIDKLGARRIKP